MLSVGQSVKLMHFLSEKQKLICVTADMTIEQYQLNAKNQLEESKNVNKNCFFFVCEIFSVIVESLLK